MIIYIDKFVVKCLAHVFWDSFIQYKLNTLPYIPSDDYSINPEPSIMSIHH